jgi:predicted permease
MRAEHRLTCFVMMTGGWVDVLGPLEDLAGGSATAYVVAVVLIGNFVILNLFIAVLLNAFQEEDEGDDKAEGAGGMDETAEDDAEGVDETKRDEEELIEEKPWPEDHTLYCFGPRNGFRRACQRLVASPRFDQIIVIAIVISSICLALDVPRLDPTSTLAQTLHSLDYLWTVLFVCEMMSKVQGRPRPRREMSRSLHCGPLRANSLPRH